VKGRAIWGSLVPYGQVWRAGANEATTVTFSKPVKVEGSRNSTIPSGAWKCAARGRPGERLAVRGRSSSSAPGSPPSPRRGVALGRVATLVGPYFFAFSSASMMLLNSSAGWAPDRRMPLMKKAGVPLTPSF